MRWENPDHRRLLDRLGCGPVHHIDHRRGSARAGELLNDTGKSAHPFTFAANTPWQAQTIKTCIGERPDTFTSEVNYMVGG